MNLTLDPQTEQTIQREIDLGRAHDAAEVIAQAVALLQIEKDNQDDWVARNRHALQQRLDAGLAAEERGETYTPDEARRILAERASRAA